MQVVQGVLLRSQLKGPGNDVSHQPEVTRMNCLVKRKEHSENTPYNDNERKKPACYEGGHAHSS